MDDLYSFGKAKYIPADPLQRSVFPIIKNVLLVLFSTVKCTFFGIFIILKSLLFSFIPRFPKNIQNQVALVRCSIESKPVVKVSLTDIFIISKDYRRCEWDWPSYWYGIGTVWV